MGEQGNFKFPLHKWFLKQQQVTACDQLTISQRWDQISREREGDTFPIYGCGIVFASTKHFFHFSSEWTLNWQENCETDISTQPWEHRNYQIRKLCRPCWFLGTHQIKRKSQIRNYNSLSTYITLYRPNKYFSLIPNNHNHVLYILYLPVYCNCDHIE